MAQKEATLILKVKEMGSSALDKVGLGIATIASAAVAAGAAIVGFAGLALRNFREQEEATNRLNQAMVNAGTFTTDLRDKYLGLATSLQKVTTFGDEQIISATAIIQQFSKQKEVTEDVLKATLDFAAAKKIDLNTAAELVGKTIGTGTNALARYGIEINAAASSSEKMTAVTKGLSDTFGGQAEAAAMGLGSIEQLKNRLSDFLETVGERIAPTITAMIAILGRMFTGFEENKHIVDAFAFAIDAAARTMLVLRLIVGTLVEKVQNDLSAAFKAVSLVMDGEFKKAGEAWVAGQKATIDDVKENWRTFNEDMSALSAARNQDEQNKRKEDEENFRASLANKRTISREDALAGQVEAEQQRLEAMAVENAQIGANEEQKLATKISALDKQFQAESNNAAKLKLLKDKEGLLNQQRAAKEEAFEKQKNENIVRDRQATLSTIATLQNANNRTLAAIGKAAGITQIAIETPVAIARALSAFPPPFNFIAAGLVGTAMAAQAARIAGVPLAEGGIVRATNGGVPAIIGEGGRDEAVIPLDDPDARSRLGGGGVTIIVNGGLLGDQSSAREFAVAVDRELLRLRQNNESLAFDEGLV